MKRQALAANEIVWFDESLVNEPLACIFSPQYWQENNRIIGSATGRGTTWFVQTTHTQAALRHYRRGGLFGKLIKDNYWFSGWEKTRSFAELEILKQLSEHGVNVPKPLAARAVKHGFFYTADLLSEKIPHAQDLVSILTKRALSALEYQHIGAEIAKMHKAGVNHTDLNIHNILLDTDGQVWIIDFDKCFMSNKNNWQISNLNRLQRSFEKELKKRKIIWTKEDITHLMRGYSS